MAIAPKPLTLSSLLFLLLVQSPVSIRGIKKNRYVATAASVGEGGGLLQNQTSATPGLSRPHKRGVADSPRTPWYSSIGRLAADGIMLLCRAPKEGPRRRAPLSVP